QMAHLTSSTPTATTSAAVAHANSLDLTELQLLPEPTFTPAEGGADANTDNVEWNVVLLKGEGYGELHRVPVRRGDNAVVAFDKVKVDVGVPQKIKALLNKILYFGEEAIFEAPITLVRPF